ncbi:hypothetical protein DV738_g4808, partial [Chaetothyriales sp. CBS 135597]
MSAHYDFSANAPIPEMVEHSYPIYDNHYNPYSRLAGPPSHYDAVAFWYRPDHPESLYEPSPGIYNPGLAISPPQMDTAGCDETRPICERCKKGGRECEFPQTTSSTSSKRSKHGDPQQAARGKGREGKAPTLESIKDEPEEMDEQPVQPGPRPTLARSRTQSTQSLSRKPRQRPTDELSPQLKEKSSPQSTTGSSPHSFPATPTSLPPYNSTTAESQARDAKIKALKPEIQKYLDFQRDHMTYYHYFYKLDPADFIHTEFIDQALSYEPLLYAVVGFAAYHYALRQPEASLVHFLHFHSKALVLLRKSLEKQTQYTEAMLLTVLQLATVEEYLGDWVNLVGHHKAGYTMLTALYPKPEAMMLTELGRRIFSWYARFDVMAGLMAGGTPRLDRRWFEANAAWYAGAVYDDPEDDVDIDGTLGSYVASSRLVAFDMARLFARMQIQMASGSAVPASAAPDEHLQPPLTSPPSSSATSPSFSPSVSTPSSSTPSHITLEQFHAEYGAILVRLEDMKSQLEALNDGFFTVKSFPVALTRPYDPAIDIVNPYIPGGLFKGALWNLNLMWIDWYAIDQMLKHQAALLLQQPLPVEELAALSLQQCRIYEAIERYPEAPKGAILGAHASLGLATLFLKKDDKHTMWARRKLADIERMGYIFPEKYRKQMALMWGLSRDRVDEANSVEDWWLPNREGMLPILHDIRRVVSERHIRGGGSTGGTGNDSGIGTGIGIGQGESDEGDKMLFTGGVQDVRDLKAIFAQLDSGNDLGYETGNHYGNNDSWARNLTKDPNRMSGVWS